MQALERLVSILHALATGPQTGLALKDVCEHTCLDKATTGRLLNSLCAQHFAKRSACGKYYSLGPELIYLGRAAERNFRLGNILKAHLTQLADETGDCCYLMVRSGDYAVCYGKAVGSYPVQAQVVQVGSRRPLGVGGTSLALLAALPDDEIKTIIKNNSQAISSYPNYSNERILTEIAETRERGYALIKSYLTDDVWTLAYPIYSPKGQPIAGIAIASVSVRFANEREMFIANAVQYVAREAEKSLHALYANTASDNI